MSTDFEANMEDLVRRAARDLAESKYAIALTGAGMSTESGIPRLVGGTEGDMDYE